MCGGLSREGARGIGAGQCAGENDGEEFIGLKLSYYLQILAPKNILPLCPPFILKLSFKYNALIAWAVFLYTDPYTDSASGDRWTSSDPSK